MGISGQISLKIDRLCFNAYFTDIILCSFNNNIPSRNEPMAKLLTSSWLVPSFLQHHQRLQILGHCLLVSVTKFQDKFESLQVVNSPNSRDKFQICHTDMYLILFLANFLVFRVFSWISRDFADLPEFCSSATVQNIRSPVKKIT